MISPIKTPLHVGRPNIGNQQKLFRRIEGILERRWLTNHGPLVIEFEAELARYLGVKHAIAICNGTVALEIAIRALDLKGEVIVPSFTFVATAHALQWQEIKPVFVDIDPATHSLSEQAVRNAITEKTTGIMGVHLWGNPCKVEALQAIAREHNLKLMFDAAHAFGCSHNGRMIGNFGECEVFSFHATKFFNTFEGGAITTNSDSVAEKIRLMQNFGFHGFDNVVYVGVNGKMTEVCAAMGLTNLESIDEFVEVNRRNRQAYAEGLVGIRGIRLFDVTAGEKHNFQYIITEVDTPEFGVSRDALCAALQAENILARRYFYPGCHRMEPYRTIDPDAGKRLPETERLCDRVLAFPTGTQTTPEEIALICDIVRRVAAH